MRALSKEAKASWILFIACWIVYAVISMTKSAYSASIASIVAEGLFPKSNAGVINSCFYLFYGGAQLLLVKLVDRISPIKLITMTLVGTIISVVGMAAADSFIGMVIFWSFCGLIQFSIWPAVLRLISEYLLPEHEGAARIAIAFSYCVGMLLNYLIAAIVLGFARWTVLFWTFAVVLVLCLVLWIVISKKTVPILEPYRERRTTAVQATERALPQSSYSLWKLLTTSGIVFLLVTAVCRSSLDAGLKAWVPTMIVENYENVSVSFASVLTTVLICVNLTGAFIATFMYPKRIRNAVWALALCFLSVIPFTVALLWTGKVAVALVVLLLTIVTTMMYAGHQLINVIIPSHFSKMGKAGSVSAVLNAFASFGAVAANFGFGFLAEHYGWTATIISWVAVAAVAFVFSAIAVPRWQRVFGGEAT